MDVILLRQNLVKGHNTPLAFSIFVSVIFVFMLTMTSLAYSAHYQYGEATPQRVYVSGPISTNNIVGELPQRVSTLAVVQLNNQARRLIAMNRTQRSDFSISWDNIIFQQQKVKAVMRRPVRRIPKLVPSSLRLLPKTTVAKTKSTIKIVSKKLLRKYRSRVKSLPAGWPLKKGRVSSLFGKRKNLFGKRGKRMHKGLDIAAKTGTPILAVEDGVVVRSKTAGAYGKLVEIKHNYVYSTRYAHNRKNLVKAGEIVRKGQVIALVGSTGRSTGPHLHFEIREYEKPINPILYLGVIDSFSLAEIFILSKYAILSKK